MHKQAKAQGKCCRSTAESRLAEKKERKKRLREDKTQGRKKSGVIRVRSLSFVKEEKFQSWEYEGRG